MPSSPRPAGLIKSEHAEFQARHHTRRTVDIEQPWRRRVLRDLLLSHPREMGGKEVKAYLTHLAVEGQRSAST